MDNNRISRREILKLAGLTIAGTIMASCAPATQSPAGSSTSVSTAPAPFTPTIAPTAMKIATTAAPSQPPATATLRPTLNPLGKYDPAITVTAARPLDDNVTFPKGSTLDNNIWTTTYKDELGIDLKYNWIAPAAQYSDRANVAVMSNQIPNIMLVNATQLQQMAENGQLSDLTEAYNSYASDLTKTIIASQGDYVIKMCSYKGKIVALPKTGSALGSTQLLWIRSDWLTKLGLAAPKTMDDVVAIAKAFSKAGTYGLAINKDLFGYFAGLEGYFNGYHAYPNQWVVKDGKLGYGSIQPEMKTALQSLQAIFKEGLIDPYFGTKDAGKVAQDANAGKVGMEYGFFWNAGAGWLQDGKKANPDLEWTPYAIVPVNNQPALVQVPNVVSVFYVVSKESANPEAAIKMMNIMYDKIFGPSAEPDKYSADAENHPIFEYPLIYGEPPDKNLVAQKKIVTALKSGDTSALNNEEKGYYANIILFKGGNLDQWGNNKMFGDGGSLAVINNYLSQKTYLADAFYGAPTPSLIEKKATLDKLQLETFTEIIMGGDISKFDDFVKTWGTLGGTQITQEVNDWFASQ